MKVPLFVARLFTKLTVAVQGFVKNSYRISWKSARLFPMLLLGHRWTEGSGGGGRGLHIRIIFCLVKIFWLITANLAPGARNLHISVTILCKANRTAAIGVSHTRITVIPTVHEIIIGTSLAGNEQYIFWEMQVKFSMQLEYQGGCVSRMKRCFARQQS
jgi:hypothetical protein